MVKLKASSKDQPYWLILVLLIQRWEIAQTQQKFRRELSSPIFPSLNFVSVRQPLSFLKICSECCIFRVDDFDNLLPGPKPFCILTELSCVDTTVTTMKEARSIMNNFESIILTRKCPECFSHTPSVFTILWRSNVILQLRNLVQVPRLRVSSSHLLTDFINKNNSLRY